MRAKEVEWLEMPWGKEPFCLRCHGDAQWVICDQCGGEGYSDHDCGEDTCCCLNPENNVECDVCDGEGGWYVCLNCNKINCSCEPYEPIVKEILKKAAEVAAQTPLIHLNNKGDNQK